MTRISYKYISDDTPRLFPDLSMHVRARIDRQRPRNFGLVTDTNGDRTIGRKVVANISLSLDGRTTRPGGEYDMGWIAPHALTDVSRAHLIKLIVGATTVP